MSVIVIMGIIISLLVVASKGARQRADMEAAKAGVTFIATKIDAFMGKKLGELPSDPNSDGITTELEIYETLAEWALEVPLEKRVDPWGNPYIIVFDRDYGDDFPLVTGTPGYNTEPYVRMAGMYRPLLAADAPKEIHSGDPATTDAYNRESGQFQVISAGPDGLLSRDNREETADIDGDGLSVNADNLTNW